MSSKTVLIGKLALVFFLTLLSFSVGTFVGKKYSDNQHQLAALEPNSGGHGAKEGHGEAGHGEVAEGHGEGHGDAHAEGGHEATAGEHGTREVASENEGNMSDEEIAKLAEEFVEDDQKTVAAKDAHGKDAHGDSHGEKAGHGETKATHGEAKTAAHEEAKATTHAAPNRETASTKEIPAAKMREHNPAATVNMESRLPNSLPKDVGQFQPGKFTVQVAAYTDEAEAKQMATELKGKGYSAFYVPSNVKGKTYYRVSVGQFATQQEASLFRAELVEKAKVGSAFVQKIAQ